MKENKKNSDKDKSKRFYSQIRTKTEIDPSFFSRFKENVYLNTEQNIVNYNYNVSYNYHPHLQNSSLESTFYRKICYENY